MVWQDLLQKAPRELVAPWIGGPLVYDPCAIQAYSLPDPPEEHGWYRFSITGRSLTVLEPTDDRPDLRRCVLVQGHLVGGRLATDKLFESAYPLIYRPRALGVPEPERTVEMLPQVFLVEPGDELFATVLTLYDTMGHLIYLRRGHPTSEEIAVRNAFLEHQDIQVIPHVPPVLELAYRVAVRGRQLTEEHRARMAKEREDKATWNALCVRPMAIREQRRLLSSMSLEEAVQAALAMGDATLLSVRLGSRPNEAIVRFRLARRRFECVVDQNTLRVIDAGICLTDELTHVKGDSWFTLESLPGVILEAIHANKLVVFRHV